MNAFMRFWYNKVVKEKRDKGQPKPAFRMIQRKDGQFGVRIRGKNGEILHSAEGFKSFQSAQNNIDATTNQILKHSNNWIWEDE